MLMASTERLTLDVVGKEISGSTTACALTDTALNSVRFMEAMVAADMLLKPNLIHQRIVKNPSSGKLKISEASIQN
jgi:hypothetical protein